MKGSPTSELVGSLGRVAGALGGIFLDVAGLASMRFRLGLVKLSTRLRNCLFELLQSFRQLPAGELLQRLSSVVFVRRPPLGAEPALVDAEREVGISSLRADRLTDEIVGLLKRGGYRSLTTASDGASERLRTEIQRKTKERHLLRAAGFCHSHGLRHLKLYMMLGLPGENDDDIDELARFGLELASVAPKVVFGIAPFVAKRRTPLDGAPFAGIAVVEAKLARLRRALKGRVELRPTSPKWAWVEYRLAQGGFAAGRAAAVAARAGARFADWRMALAEVPLPEAAPDSPATLASPAGAPIRLRGTVPSRRRRGLTGAKTS